MPSTRQRRGSGPTARERPAATPKPPSSAPSLRRRVDAALARAYSAWSPETMTAFRIIALARVFAANASIVTDCDEVFNYWEPMHYILQGFGQQTWEYSPLFALRSYAFLLFPYAPFATIGQWVGEMFDAKNGKMMGFFLCRQAIGAISAATDTALYAAVRERYGGLAARFTLLFLALAPGLFHASVALLPSSFAMALSTLGLAYWIRSRPGTVPPQTQGGQAHLHSYVAGAVCSFAAASLYGWPFAIVVALPAALDLLARFGIIRVFVYAAIAAAALLASSVVVDTHYYGKPVVAMWNLVQYNVFSSKGPELYGIEPASFYIKNLLVNFHVAFAMFLLAPAAVLLVRPLKRSVLDGLRETLPLTGAFLWIAFLSALPHKEERFGSVCFPVIAAGAGIAVARTNAVVDALFGPPPAERPRQNGSFVSVDSPGALFLWTIAIAFLVLSAARTGAMLHNYGAPNTVYSTLYAKHLRHMDPVGDDVNICVGKEWHRFMSSYFLPSARFHLRYLEDGFHGQLPQAFGPNGTRGGTEGFNDDNREDRSRYVDLEMCNFVIDVTDPGKSSRFERSSHFRRIFSTKFVHVQRARAPARILYIPFLSEYLLQDAYGEYVILRNENRGEPAKAA